MLELRVTDPVSYRDMLLLEENACGCGGMGSREISPILRSLGEAMQRREWFASWHRNCCVESHLVKFPRQLGDRLGKRERPESESLLGGCFSNRAQAMRILISETLPFVGEAIDFFTTARSPVGRSLNFISE